MGQSRGVEVINLVAQGSIEEGILGVLAFKRSLFAGVLDGGDSAVFMNAAAAAAADGAAPTGPRIATDPATGQRILSLPLTDPATVQRLATGLAALLARLPR